MVKHSRTFRFSQDILDILAMVTEETDEDMTGFIESAIREKAKKEHPERLKELRRKRRELKHENSG